MKIRTGNKIREFNEALGKCTSVVWLMGPDDECYNMKDADEYIDGILRITEKNGDQFGIFTSSYEDQEIMANFLRRLAA
ncbi:MAG: hypothetical protein IJH81_01960 [Lachnospiraceae bacterium]|nr:hypothetical protein [Lachnospiraceae bacterium]